MGEWVVDTVLPLNVAWKAFGQSVLTGFSRVHRCKHANSLHSVIHSESLSGHSQSRVKKIKQGMGKPNPEFGETNYKRMYASFV